jgi:hypothetical protein
MRRLKFLKVAIVLPVLFSLFVLHANAAVDPAIISKCSDSLVRLELMKGDASGNLKLQDKVSRCEFVTLVIRMLGYEGVTDTSGVEVTFTDISPKHWSYDNIKIALKYRLLTGYTDNTIRPDNNVTFTEAQAILVRALGYESTMTGKWPDNVLNKSAELGLNRNLDLPADREITRGETSVLIYNSLTVNFNR